MPATSATSFGTGEYALVIVGALFGAIAAVSFLIFIVALFVRLFGKERKCGGVMGASIAIAIACMIVGGVTAFVGWQMAQARGITILAEQQLRHEGFDVLRLSVSDQWAQVVTPAGCAVNVDLYQRQDVPPAQSFFVSQHGLVATNPGRLSCH